MTAYLNRVEIQVADIQKMLDALAAKEQEVRGLLDKADKKRRTPGEDVRKWSKVLSNLEHSLDEVRRRRNALEVDLGKARQSLAWAHAHPGETPENAPSTEVETESMEVALNLEQISEIEGRLEDADTETPEQERKRLEAEVEFANQCRAATSEERPVRRQQDRLRVALDKIQQRSFDQLSREELQMTIATHSLLSRKLEIDANDKRLLEMLGAAIAVLREQLARGRQGT